MNIPPSEARNLTLWDYEAILTEWNRQRDTDPQPDPMTVDEFKRQEQFFADNPHLLN